MKSIQLRHAALGAVGSPLETIGLRSASAFSSIQIDEANGVIRNASVMTVGPAMGHGFELDQTSLQQLVDAIKDNGGSAKVRFKHPEDNNADDLGTDVGFVKNVRVEGNQVRGDIHLASYAKSLPGVGNVWDYLISKARDAPTSFGLSAVIAYELETLQDGGAVRPVARIHGAVAVDFVGTPAANPNGLLSQKAKITMDYLSAYKSILSAKFGLAADASDEQAQAFFSVLSADKQKEVADANKPDTGSAATGDPEKEKPAATMSAKTEGKDVIALRAQRVQEITALAAVMPGIGQDQIKLAIANNLDVAAAETAFLAHLKETAKPVASIAVGENRQIAALKVASPQAVVMRMGLKVSNPHELALKLSALPVCEQFRRLMVSLGVKDAEYMSNSKVAEYLANPYKLRQASLGQSTSDFDNLLMDASNMALRTSYDEVQPTWSKWAKRTTNPDFRAGNRIQLSEIGMPLERPEGGEIKYDNLIDGKETVTLTEYVRGVKLTHRAIVNDTLGGFADIIKKQGASCGRLEDYLAYRVLTANATMADGGTLFNSTAITTTGGHANIVTSGAAPTVASLAATSLLMRKQKGLKKTTADDAGAYLDIRPGVLIVPAALEVVAAQLVSSNVDPAKNNTTNNPYFNSLEVVSHALLDETSAVQWYIAAKPNEQDGVEVCFLTDEQKPVLKQETEFDTDDVKFAVRHTVTAKAIDYRGLVRNNGQ